MSLMQKIWSQTLIGMTVLGISLGSVAMERLGDEEMSGISGQAGVTMEMETKASIDTFSYFTDGNGIHLDDISVGSASTAGEADFRTYALDIRNDGSLDIGYDIQDQRIAVGGMRLDDSNGDSVGSFWMDRDMAGNFVIQGGNEHSDDGYTFDSEFELTNGRFGYQTNGHQVFLDDVNLDVRSVGQTLHQENGVVFYSVPVDGSLDIGAIRYAAQQEGFRGDASSLASYGSIEMDFDFQSDFEIQAGGRFGSEGFRVDNETTLNTANFLYRTRTNGKDYDVAFKDMSGYSQVTDLRIDVAPDFTAEARQGLGFTLTGSESQASGNLAIGSIELGESGSIGSFNMEWLYENQDVNGETFSNQLFLMAGGHPDAGSEGMRLAIEWSLADAQLDYTTNENTVIFDGIQSWGRGDVTVNVTGDETLNGTQFYEGLRMGFEDVSGGYRMDGLRVGKGKSEAESAEVQGGVELLGALGMYRSFEFGSLDGHYTFGPGGSDGEGITINSHIVIQDGRIGALTEEFGQGIWADDLEFEAHIRDMTVDVTAEGLSLIQGEAWSTMDIGNLRVGDADNGASFGRIVWQRYGQDNEMVISAPDSGREGLQIALTHVFSEASGDRQNQFIWETGRNTDASGVPENGTGMQLVMSNIHTDDYGVKTDLEIDVRDANDGTDNLGFSVNSRTRLKELNIGSVDLVHRPDASDGGGAATALHGVSIQNMDMESNLTATPIP